MATITGTFFDITNKAKYQVVLNCPKLASNITIGENENADVWFGSDPVVITRDWEDSFQHVIRSSCQIDLVSKIWLGDYLFAENATDISVNVNVMSGSLVTKQIFFGYVEPQTYSQPYTHKYNSITLNCVDALSVLEEQRMTDLGTDGTSYNTLKEKASNMTLYSLITTILHANTPNTAIYFDGSTGINSISLVRYPKRIFTDIHLSSILWLGDSMDDMMTNLEILEAIMQYLNLYIVFSLGPNNSPRMCYYIYDLNMIKNNSSIKWYNIDSLSSNTVTTTSNVFPIDKSSIAADDTNISMAETYNQIAVKASADSFDTIINNPLDTSALNNPFGTANRYMTEFVTLGEGKTAAKRMKKMLQGEWHDNDQGQFFRHWYVEYLNNPQWRFNVYNASSSTPVMQPLENISNVHCMSINTDTAYSTATALQDLQNQWVMTRAAQSINGSYSKSPIYISTSHPFQPFTWGNCIGACMFNQYSTGKINPTDASTAYSKQNNKNVLAITINNLYSQNLRTSIYNMMYNSQGEIINRNMCLCDYSTTGGAYVPVDDNITYYLVFTGKIVLSPFIKNIIDYYNFNPKLDRDLLKKCQSQFKYGNDDHCYYSRIFYRTLNPTNNLGNKYNTTKWVKHPDAIVDMRNLVPFIADDGLKDDDYEYLSESGDTIEKVGVLVCRLQIGNKYLSEEVVTNEDGSTTFTENYTWTEDQSAVFTLGFDPKITDYIVGQEFKIGKDISMYKNIDVDYGMAIPIKRSDGLSGNVRFQILYPTSIIWNKNTRQHHTMLRHTKWTSEGIDLFCNDYSNMDMDNCDNRVENIFISELKAVLYSDNAGKNWNQENDIIYISNEQNKYIRAKDDIEFKIVSGLTQEEAAQFGVSNMATINSAINSNGSPLITMTKLDTAKSGFVGFVTNKPERIYVNDRYLEYCKPRHIVTSTVTRHYYPFNARFTFRFFPSKNFLMKGDSMDLKYNSETITAIEYE